MYSVTVLFAFIFNVLRCAIQSLFLLSCFCNLFCAVSGAGFESANLLSGNMFCNVGLATAQSVVKPKLGAAKRRLMQTMIIYRLELRRMFSCCICQVLQKGREKHLGGVCELSQVLRSENCKVQCRGILQRGMNVWDVWRTSKCAHLLRTLLTGWGLLNGFKSFVEGGDVILKMGWVVDWGPIGLVNHYSFGVPPIPHFLSVLSCHFGSAF